MDIIVLGTAASLGAGLMTGIGALPVLFGRSPGPGVTDAMLGFAAGVMLSASFLSLILPGIAAAEASHGSAGIASAIVGAGILIGALGILWLNQVLPHEHFIHGRDNPPLPASGRTGACEMTAPTAAGGAAARRIWLFVFAITIHNFPEGMAVGVSFAGEDISKGMSMAIGIGLQNAPEGLAVAAALVVVGTSRARAVAIATLTGLIEPVGGLIGVALASLSQAVLPWGLGFAAGAMICVISHEIIPETHRHGSQRLGTIGLTIGLVLMMILDVTLG